MQLTTSCCMLRYIIMSLLFAGTNFSAFCVVYDSHPQQLVSSLRTCKCSHCGIPCSDSCFLRSTSLGSYPLQMMILNWSGELRRAFTASMWDAPSRETPLTSRIRLPTWSRPSRSAAPPFVICVGVWAWALGHRSV